MVRRVKKTHRKKQGRIKEVKKRHFPFVRLFYYVALIGFIVIALYTIFFSPSLKLKKITINELKRIDAQEVKEEIWQLLPEEGLLGAQRPNLLLTSQGKIQKHVESVFPEIESVTIEKKIPDTLLVNIIERGTMIIACDANSSSIQESCMILNTKGVTQKKADFSSALLKSNPYVQININESLSAKEAGKKVISKKQYDNILFILKELPFTIGIKVSSEIQKTAVGSAHIRLKTDEGWELLFDAEQEPRVILEILNAFLTAKGGSAFRSQLTEVDIRLTDKIFYRIRNEDEKKVSDVKNET